MTIKLAVLFGVVMVCRASLLEHKGVEDQDLEHAVSSQNIVLYHTPEYRYQSKDIYNDARSNHQKEVKAYPKYEFNYAVTDEDSKDHKKHWETRDGDSVQGQYSFVQSDGLTRTVSYTSDGKNGFKAHVSTSDKDEKKVKK